jgi:glycerol-3-phosphate dehydrogenase (NAD(P)+)
MKIGCLGSGAWGFCLAHLLAKKGYDVVVWSRNKQLVEHLSAGKSHPAFPKVPIPATISFTTDILEATDAIDLLVESVTSGGLRQVFSSLQKNVTITYPVVLTSKGIEQGTGLLLSDVVIDIYGPEIKPFIGYLSGPSHAEEVIQGLPATVSCSAFEEDVTTTIQQVFSTPTFRVYPNPDIKGLEFGGAMKNVIAIACGISDGLGFGDNAKAALMTRGLHEMRKLGIQQGCDPQTLQGLSGMGDLCVTCLSIHSRNYRFGRLIAEGKTLSTAKKDIGEIVEGAYSCVSALQLSRKHDIAMPITEGVYKILYEGLSPLEAVKQLMNREIKEEYL